VVSVSTPDLFAHNFGAWFGGESDWQSNVRQCSYGRGTSKWVVVTLIIWCMACQSLSSPGWVYIHDLASSGNAMALTLGNQSIESTGKFWHGSTTPMFFQLHGLLVGDNHNTKQVLVRPVAPWESLPDRRCSSSVHWSQGALRSVGRFY
jgi:hypothetical protein